MLAYVSGNFTFCGFARVDYQFDPSRRNDAGDRKAPLQVLDEPLDAREVRFHEISAVEPFIGTSTVDPGGTLPKCGSFDRPRA
jgi:hypothetical protein